MALEPQNLCIISQSYLLLNITSDPAHIQELSVLQERLLLRWCRVDEFDFYLMALLFLKMHNE
jgi:hypothetical protein